MSQPADDDLYQNDGEQYQNGIYYPDAPADQKAEAIAEAVPVVSSYPIMGAVSAWFDEAVNACDNLDNIQLTSLTINGVKYSRDVSIEAQVLAYQLLKSKLQEKANEFEEFRGEDDA